MDLFVLSLSVMSNRLLCSRAALVYVPTTTHLNAHIHNEEFSTSSSSRHIHGRAMKTNEQAAAVMLVDKQTFVVTIRSKKVVVGCSFEVEHKGQNNTERQEKCMFFDVDRASFFSSCFLELHQQQQSRIINVVLSAPSSVWVLLFRERMVYTRIIFQG